MSHFSMGSLCVEMGFTQTLLWKLEVKSKVFFMIFFENLSWPYGTTFHTEVSKGQLISKCPFGVFKSPQKTTKFFPGFLL